MTKRASEKLYENTGKLFTTRSFKSLIAVHADAVQKMAIVSDDV